jgi:hypothetical protein
MKKDLIERLEFGCPFKQGTLGEKDAEAAERIMAEAARAIKESTELFGEIASFCNFICNSLPDTAIKGEIENMALYLAHHPLIIANR